MVRVSDICTTCGRAGWPECGHLEGMPPGISEGSADEAALIEFENAETVYRKRGRPKLPPEMKRREKLVIAVTGPELKAMIHAAADADDGPVKVQDWARDILIAASKPKKEEP